MIGLCVDAITQPFGADVQVSGVFSPPISTAFTPLLEMNSSEVGRSRGSVMTVKVPSLTPSAMIPLSCPSSRSVCDRMTVRDSAASTP